MSPKLARHHTLEQPKRKAVHCSTPIRDVLILKTILLFAICVSIRSKWPPTSAWARNGVAHQVIRPLFKTLIRWLCPTPKQAQPHCSIRSPSFLCAIIQRNNHLLHQSSPPPPPTTTAALAMLNANQASWWPAATTLHDPPKRRWQRKSRSIRKSCHSWHLASTMQLWPTMANLAMDVLMHQHACHCSN